MSNDKKALSRLQSACERAKLTLSVATNTKIEVDSLFEGEDFSHSLSRAKFEELCLNDFRKTLVPVENVLRESGVSKS
jgi:L1 cell adhesion molecule like protein